MKSDTWLIKDINKVYQCAVKLFGYLNPLCLTTGEGCHRSVKGKVSNSDIYQILDDKSHLSGNRCCMGVIKGIKPGEESRHLQVDKVRNCSSRNYDRTCLFIQP